VRGRLIFPFGIELCLLDPVGTATDPGYNSTFQEPEIIPTEDGVGTIGRRELDPIIVPGQFYTQEDFMYLQMVANGNLAQADVRIVFHFRTLEDMGLIEESTGLAKIKVGDRINAVYDKKGVTLIQAIPTPPGLYVIQANPLFGLGSNRNLLAVHFKSRDQGKAAQ
jgi:hypothetical protein